MKCQGFGPLYLDIAFFSNQFIMLVFISYLFDKLQKHAPSIFGGGLKKQ
jgi:hypothetical protein